MFPANQAREREREREENCALISPRNQAIGLMVMLYRIWLPVAIKLSDGMLLN